MRYFLLLILLLFLISCSITPLKLNNAVDKNQRKSIKKSPFTSKVGMDIKLDIQKKVREQYITDIIELKKKYKFDTIVLVESYMYNHSDSFQAELVTIYLDTFFITYELKDYKKRIYEKTESSLSKYFIDKSDYCHYQIQYIYEDLRKGKKWNKNPQDKGSDNGYDGTRKLYTVLFPSGKIESMYMRFWIRKRKIK